MNNEKEVVDLIGLPIDEKCQYIKVVGRSAEDASILLANNGIPNKVFDTSGRAFCTSLAESELRGVVESRGVKNDDAELLGILYRDQASRGLYEKMGTFINSCKVAGIVSDIYYNEILEPVSALSQSANIFFIYHKRDDLKEIILPGGRSIKITGYDDGNFILADESPRGIAELLNNYKGYDIKEIFYHNGSTTDRMSLTQATVTNSEYGNCEEGVKLDFEFTDRKA